MLQSSNKKWGKLQNCIRLVVSNTTIPENMYTVNSYLGVLLLGLGTPQLIKWTGAKFPGKIF